MSNILLEKTTLKDIDAKGAFKRKDSVFRNKIAPDSTYPPQCGRYILYISYACPWASRCSAYRVAKGLENVIELAVTSPVWDFTRPGQDGHEGWVFDLTYPGCTEDPLHQFKSVRDIYELSMHNTNDDFDTRYTVPVLFDRKTMTIVNNESSQIIRMLNSEFNHFARHPQLDLCPVALQPQIDAINAKTYEPICNGVYKCGFAQSQEAYDEAATVLFDNLDEMEQILSHQRYLVGDVPTQADVRLFCSLVRFDEVYATHFKCNKRLIR